MVSIFAFNNFFSKFSKFTFLFFCIEKPKLHSHTVDIFILAVVNFPGLYQVNIFANINFHSLKKKCLALKSVKINFACIIFRDFVSP